MASLVTLIIFYIICKWIDMIGAIPLSRLSALAAIAWFMGLLLTWWSACRLRVEHEPECNSVLPYKQVRPAVLYGISKLPPGNWFFYLNVPKLNSSGCVTCLAEMKKAEKKADQACSVCQFSDRERELEFSSFADESIPKILSSSPYTCS